MINMVYMATENKENAHTCYNILQEQTETHHKVIYTAHSVWSACKLY